MKFGLANLNFFRLGLVAGNRGTFFGLNNSKNGWQKVVAMFCLQWAADLIRNEINQLADVIQCKNGRVILTHCICWYPLSSAMFVNLKILLPDYFIGLFSKTLECIMWLFYRVSFVINRIQSRKCKTITYGLVEQASGKLNNLAFLNIWR